MEFEWDEAKRFANLRKHGVDFADAQDIEWQTVRESEDHRKDYGERRWVLFGRISDRVHVLVYTRRAERIRVISLRRASDREVFSYESEN